MRVLTGLVLACLFAGSASAATINVPADQGTIQAAIDAASDGDTVLVAPGTYYEKLNFNGKAITVASSGGAAVTILDGNNTGPIVTFENDEGNTSVLRGFTLTHGFVNDYGSAVHLSGGAPTIEDNRFVANAGGTGYWGAAIGGDNSSPVILRNYFSENTCGSQFLDSVVGFQGFAPVIADNVFVNNPCPALVLVESTKAAPEIYNNTFVGNRAGLLMNNWFKSTGTRFSNNLIAFNQYGLESYAGLSDGPLPSWQANLVYGNTKADYHGFPNRTGSDGNISSDPKLKDWAGSDVHLLYGSPAIDVGDSTVTQVSATDFYGNPRVGIGNPGDSAVVDIGAAEYEPPVVTAIDGSLVMVLSHQIVGVLHSANADPGEPLRFRVVTQPQHGKVTIHAPTGAFKYVSFDGYGIDSFTFEIVDPYGTVSNTAIEQLTLAEMAPTAVNSVVQISGFRPIHRPLQATPAYEGQILHFQVVTPAVHGIVTVSDPSRPVYTYSPARGYRGSDSFTFRVVDQWGTASNIATVSIVVH